MPDNDDNDGCPDDHSRSRHDDHIAIDDNDDGVDHLVPRYDNHRWPLNDAGQFFNACHNVVVGHLYPDEQIDLGDVEHLHAVCGRILDEHRRRHPGDTPGDRAG